MYQIFLVAGIGVSLAGVCTSWVREPHAQAAPDGPKEAAAKNHKELAKFDSNWEMVSSTTDGKVADGNKEAKIILVFESGRMAALEGERPVGYGTIKVNAGENPAQIDWKYGDSPAKTGTSKGIYKFDGDTLSICVGDLDPTTGRSKTRPTRFESREGTRTTLQVYKRVKRSIRLRDLHFPRLRDLHFPADLNEPPSK